MGQSGSFNVHVQMIFGLADLNPQCGCYPAGQWLEGTNTIEIYSQTGHPGDIYDNDLSIPRLTLLIQHELGHVFGIANSSCSNDIMSTSWWASGGNITDADCGVADTQNTTADEATPPPPPPGPPGYCDPETGCCTPIILNLDNDEYRLTSPDDGVWFDIDGDGAPDRISWTEEGASLAFLWLDKNSNGAFEGFELFGNSGINGFDMLRLYDHGGDYLLNEADYVWRRLRLWIDWNHDGVAQAYELSWLRDSPLREIDLRYRETSKKDRYGNRFPFGSTGWYRRSDGVLVARPIYDVIFAHQEGE